VPISETSESDARLLQHLGWGMGRRGMDSTQATAHQQQADSLMSSPSRLALTDFWKHFSGLSWLLGRQQQIDQQSSAQHTQHEAATAVLRVPYDDVLSSVPLPVDKQGQVLAARMVTKAANADQLEHFQMVKLPAVRGMPAKTIIIPEEQHTAGDSSLHDSEQSTA